MEQKDTNNKPRELTPEELDEHLVKRIAKFRHKVIPWIDHFQPLQNANVLEIGCGTGSSTVALAEQGANVYAIDISEDSLKIAHRRLELYKQSATLIQCNAIDIQSRLGHISFDCIIFFATLEHMINEERICSLPWRGKCCTPMEYFAWSKHRTVYGITTFIPPFFLLICGFPTTWHINMQDSVREKNSMNFCDNPPGNMLGFLRRGRGVSYHEFDVAIENFDHSQVISSLEDFSKRKFIGPIYDRFRHRNYHAFKCLLKKVGPEIHTGFYEPWLDILIRKN